jgi:hypothetical protein
MARCLLAQGSPSPLLLQFRRDQDDEGGKEIKGMKGGEQK